MTRGINLRDVFVAMTIITVLAMTGGTYVGFQQSALDKRLAERLDFYHKNAETVSAQLKQLDERIRRLELKLQIN